MQNNAKTRKRGAIIRKSQTWSIDVLVAVFIFVAIFIMFTGIMASMSKSQQQKRLSEKGEKITKILSADTDISFIKGNKVNEEKLKQVVGDYDALKKELDYENFCIYFEDEEGNLVPIQGVKLDENGEPERDAEENLVIVEYNAIGSNKAKVGDIACGVPK